MTALKWRKSSRSKGGDGDNCVEVALLPAGGVAVRDSKLGEASAVLSFPRLTMTAFLLGAKNRDVDGPVD